MPHRPSPTDPASGAAQSLTGPPSGAAQASGATSAGVGSAVAARGSGVPGGRRLILLALAVAGLALAAWRFPVQEWATQVSPSAAVLIGAALLCALVPRTPVSLIAGALFGAQAGAAWAFAAALIAAVVTFAAGRWAGRDLLAQRAGDRLRRMDTWIARRGLLAVIVVRLLPIAPFGLVGYAYGASSVLFRHYLLGTAIGALPSAISYAVIGAAAVNPDSLSWLTFLPAAAGIAISSFAALHWRRASRTA